MPHVLVAMMSLAASMPVAPSENCWLLNHHSSCCEAHEPFTEPNCGCACLLSHCYIVDESFETPYIADFGYLLSSLQATTAECEINFVYCYVPGPPCCFLDPDPYPLSCSSHVYPQRLPDCVPSGEG